MIKKILFILLIPFLILSCMSNEFEFTKEVDADVIGFTNRYIGLTYDLYGVTVFQDVYMESLAEFSFFSKMKKIPLSVFVEGDDFENSDRIFISLNYKGAEFGGIKQERMHDLSTNSFISQDMKIPTFKWLMFNDEEYTDGITPQQLRVKLKEDGEETPEAVVKKEEKKKEEKKSL